MEQITSCYLEYCINMPFILQDSVLDSDLKYNIFQLYFYYTFTIIQLYFLQNNEFFKEFWSGQRKQD